MPQIAKQTRAELATVLLAWRYYDIAEKTRDTWPLVVERLTHNTNSEIASAANAALTLWRGLSSPLCCPCCTPYLFRMRRRRFDQAMLHFAEVAKNACR